MFINKRNPLTITDFTGKYAYRDIVEQVLLLQALHRGGYNSPIQLVSVDFYQRRIKLINQGEVHLSATPSWYADIKDKENLFISPPLTQEGEFTAGLYVYEKNEHLLKLSPPNIQSLFAVSNRNWKTDWAALCDMNLAGLIHVGQFPLMTQMLVKGRADFMLAPFYNTPDLSFTQDGFTFKPIPNVRVKLPGSRHFVISKQHPDAKNIYLALTKGLTILRAEGIIKKAYIQSGFFNKAVENWPIINE
ncbi:hypothetical protein GCM10009111_21770 [Colwellia asteriadis]|uniref:Solute-binding protein family 3/N-terminal domain-containing protein n=1 Tax=Colwellia asteriadis TaxID=517723 RepID=A0ABP3WI42_9GAMM